MDKILIVNDQISSKVRKTSYQNSVHSIRGWGHTNVHACLPAIGRSIISQSQSVELEEAWKTFLLLK